MASLTAWHRIYFAAVGLFALWVGIWGYFIPAEVGRALPWQVPPLHARFIGSMYLSGAVLMFGALTRKALIDVRIALPMAAIWTGMLGLVSFLHLGEFDFGHRPVWFWFFAYIAYPIIGAFLFWRYPTGAGVSAQSPAPMWLRMCLWIFGGASALLAICLFTAPGFMTTFWPWKISPLLAQIYAGPFLSYAFGALMVAGGTDRRAIGLPLLASAIFAVLVLSASVIHSALFTTWSASAILWFGGFVLAGLVFAGGALWSAQRRQPA